MDILAQALAIVERQQAYSTAMEQMAAAERLRQLADEMEASAMALVDYDMIGDPRQYNGVV